MEKWTDQDVQALLSIYSDEEIQRELLSSSRNAKVYQKISSCLADLGIQHSAQRCREKIKKMKQDYKRMKDTVGGSARRTSKWFECLDAILGARSAYLAGGESQELMLEEMNGVRAEIDEETYTEGEQYSEIIHPTEPSYDSPATSSSPIPHLPHPTFLGGNVLGKRKRDADFLEAMRDMEEANLEMLRRGYEQRERYLQLLQEHDAQETELREREFTLRREARHQEEAFQQGFLSILDRLVQILERRNAQKPPESPPLD